MGPVMNSGLRIKIIGPNKMHPYLGKPTLIGLPATTSEGDACTLYEQAPNCTWASGSAQS